MIQVRLIFITYLVVLQVNCVSAQESGIGKTYTYCVDPDWMPYEGLVNGKHVGISKDYLSYFSEQTGIKFQLVETKSWTQTLDFAKDGRCDLVPMLNSSPARNEYLNFTQPFFESPNVLITRIDDDAIPGMAALGNRQLGIVKNYRHAEYIKRFYPNLNLREVDSEKQGLLLLAEGEIDVMLGSLLSTNVIKNELNLNNLTISGYAETHDSLAMGVSNSVPFLVEQINRVIKILPENRKLDIYKRWYKVTPIPKSVNGWLFPLFLSVCVAIGMTVWVRRHQIRIQQELQKKDGELENLQSILIDKNRTVEFLSIQDEFTKLNNRNYMLQKADEEISRFLRFRSPVTLILVNASKEQDSLTGAPVDSSSNNANNGTIAYLADIVIEKTRDVDLASRWSDDEVLILCPQTSGVSAQILAERILSEVELHSLRQFSDVKVSIGIATLGEDEDFTMWLEKAFSALRNAKKQGSHSMEVSSY